VRLYRGTEGPVCAHNDDGVRAGNQDLWRVGAAQVQAAAGGGAIGWESWERGRKVVRGCAHNDGVVRTRSRWRVLATVTQDTVAQAGDTGSK
jgi:hypothetical protein